MLLERKCEVYKLPIFLNRQGTDWGVFWFAFRHPLYRGIWSPWSGLWFAAENPDCVQYELMECSHEMSREDLYSMKYGPLWLLAIPHVYARVRFRVRYWWIMGTTPNFVRRGLRRLFRRVLPLVHTGGVVTAKDDGPLIGMHSGEYIVPLTQEEKEDG